MGAAPQIGRLVLGRLPRVVLAVDRDSTSLAKAASEGVHILEVRVDQFERVKTPLETIYALRKHGLPMIGTVRSRPEGGDALISDNERAEIYKKIVKYVDAIDIEMRSVGVLNAVRASAKAENATLILSHHNFKETPDDAGLDAIISEASKLEPDIIKLATFAKTAADVETLLRCTLKHRDKNLVTIALGPVGSISRLTFPLYGSLMTYTSTKPSQGQIPVETLVDHLRFYYPELNEEYVQQLGLLEYA